MANDFRQLNEAYESTNRDAQRLDWLFASPKNFASVGTTQDWIEFRETTEGGFSSQSSADWFREVIDERMNQRLR